MQRSQVGYSGAATRAAVPVCELIPVQSQHERPSRKASATISKRTATPATQTATEELDNNKKNWTAARRANRCNEPAQLSHAHLGLLCRKQ